MRLVTRADWDGLVCATLLSSVEQIDFIQFTYPKDIQDGRVTVPVDSIIANLPYHPNCAMWFDHHISEEERGLHAGADFKGRFALAPSAARLVYEFYKDDLRLRRMAELVEATDRIDSAQLTMEDVLSPSGYVLLSYTMDPRTGLKDLDRQAYFLLLMDWLKTKSVSEILAQPEVSGLTERLRTEDQAHREALQQHSRLDGNVIITDFRGLQPPPGNRFLVYTLYPEANVSVRFFDSPDGRISTISVGHSIFNRTCRSNIGSLLGEYRGGGHRGVGTAQFPKAESEPRFAEIIARLKQAG